LAALLGVKKVAGSASWTVGHWDSLKVALMGVEKAAMTALWLAAG
jgi:hypothetical protein